MLRVQGKTAIAVTSGANMNFDRLRLVAGAVAALAFMHGKAVARV